MRSIMKVCTMVGRDMGGTGELGKGASGGLGRGTGKKAHQQER